MAYGLEDLPALQAGARRPWPGRVYAAGHHGDGVVELVRAGVLGRIPTGAGPQGVEQVCL